jgi:hypothetical protein
MVSSSIYASAAALDAIAAGQPVAVASTRAYGWSIKYREG